MKNQKFNVGDRVVCNNIVDCNEYVKGKVGTVIDIYSNINKYIVYGIEFDNYIYGHSCDGRGKQEYCWNCSEKDLTLIEKTSEKGDCVEIDEKFNNCIDCNGKCKDEYGFYCVKDNLELIKKSKNSNKSMEVNITINGTDTIAILKENGEEIKRSIARLHPDDKFDFNIGSKLAFDRLFDNENKFNIKSITGVKRIAKAGEYVKVLVDDCYKTHGYREYEKGEIIKIVRRNENCITDSDSKRAYYIDKTFCYLDKEEYVVLEGVTDDNIEEYKKYILYKELDYSCVDVNREKLKEELREELKEEIIREFKADVVQNINDIIFKKVDK